ncbi:hypothetical protein PPERSA_12156 [Pseudocohnilembus persalinus]|uniref:MORN motif n=1 Tax=Pseudocohnilembus persalinus TaxID=266149 RepID=A0A0V0R6R2_PSEPJ|nr:hypothetical protein PPERSA_12156 [Pseudocohnilembus persalinus]|eukprot:KRX10198.1 hypothetical protein PPERSA_12156 [Pseudocohnilembus persalinus]
MSQQLDQSQQSYQNISQQNSRPQTSQSQQINQQLQEAINQFPRQNDPRKQYQKLEELNGLEIDQELVCDLPDHKKQPILFICVNDNCSAPRKLVCGYCNQMHADHLTSLQRVEEFRTKVNQARGNMNESLANFTNDQKRNLLDLSLYDFIKLKQQDLIRQFETFLNLQHDQILKFIDASTENYLFEEQEVIANIGGLYENIERTFASSWPLLQNKQIKELIKFHNQHEDYINQVDKLDIRRGALSKEMTETLNDYFLQTEMSLSDLEQEATNSIRKMLDQLYNLEKADEKLNLTATEGKTNSTVNQSFQSQNNNQQGKDFHSTLFKEQHAPKQGWRTIDVVPLKYLSMPYIEKTISKIGKFTFKENAITKVEVVSLPPVTNQRQDVYLGEWRNGLRWGKGEFWWKDGHYYVGTWEKGKPEGFGRMIYRNGNTYEGEFHEGMRHGKGIHYHLCGSKYEGQFKNDLPHGNGTEYLMNGDIFSGTFVEGLKEGKGELRGVDGSIINSWWVKNRIQGKGEWLHNDKRLYVGDFKDDMKHGQGILTWPDRRVYEGQFYKNKMHGIGIWTEQDGAVRKGEWQHGKRIQWLEELKKGDVYQNKKAHQQMLKQKDVANSIASRANVMKNETMTISKNKRSAFQK